MGLSVHDAINEAIMVDDSGCILEGISSNVFAILNGTVYTAPLDKVLKGTMRYY
jgi:branched-subunit amino acid aminotransferase/4-amino-4-deoxychorismate lyase